MIKNTMDLQLLVHLSYNLRWKHENGLSPYFTVISTTYNIVLKCYFYIFVCLSGIFYFKSFFKVKIMMDISAIWCISKIFVIFVCIMLQDIMEHWCINYRLLFYIQIKLLFSTLLSVLSLQKFNHQLVFKSPACVYHGTNNRKDYILHQCSITVEIKVCCMIMYCSVSWLKLSAKQRKTNLSPVHFDHMLKYFKWCVTFLSLLQV